MERPFPAYGGNEPYIFVCYAHEDDEIVYSEIHRLHDQGFNIWYDEGIAPGSTWRDEVAEALSRCKLFLYFVTPQSVASANCQKEVNYVLSRNQRILSVHLQPVTLTSGLELGLSDMQAIIKQNHTEVEYEAKLTESLRALLTSTPQQRSRAPDALQPLKQEEPDLTSIAVLPLVNRSVDAENEYLCDGISEELINGLSEIKQLNVASQLSAFTFKNKIVDIKTVGGALSVGSVLSGSVQKSGNRLRISVRLDQVKDGTTLWSHHYDREIEDLFELQDNVARQVIDALKVKLGPDQPDQLIDVGTTSVEAYHAYLLGNYEFPKHTHAGFKRAINHYQQAIHYDENYANAHGREGLCYMMLVDLFGIEREEVLDAFKGAFHRARSLGFDPRSAKAWNGQSYTWLDIENFLDSDRGQTLNGRAWVQRQLKLVIDLICDPMDPRNQGDPDNGYYHLRMLLSVLLLGNACLEVQKLRHSKGKEVQFELGDALSQLGRYEEAVVHYTRALEQDNNNHFSRHLRALDYARLGQISKAEEDLEILDRVWGKKNFNRFLHPFWLGDMEQARDHFAGLASSPRFENRLKIVGWIMLSEFETALVLLESLLADGQGTQQPMSVPMNLRTYAPQHIVDKIEQEPRYRTWLTKVGLDSAMRQEVINQLNQISHITGVTVKLDEEY